MTTIKPSDAATREMPKTATPAIDSAQAGTTNFETQTGVSLQTDQLQSPPQPSPALTGANSQVSSPLAQGIGAPQANLETKPTRQAQNDGFRFSKHSGVDITFPLTGKQAEALRNSNAVSPFLLNNPRVYVDSALLPKPTHPEDAGFWAEFEEIIDIQMERHQNKPASDFIDLPKLFDGYTMDEGAQAVRADFPSKWPTALVEQFLGEGAKMDPNIMKPMSQDDFVNGPVLLARTVGWAVSEVSPSAFALKWHEGRARPESVAWGIHTGQLDAPQRIKDKVAAMKLTKAEDFTAYQDGCPKHPSWPAMHSAASSASLYLAVMMDLSPQQLAEARKLDYAVAHFRSMAGVHYETDNRAGLTLGQEVIAKQLPDFLAQFGADPDAVRAKIEKIRIDWYEYDAKQSQQA